MKVNQENKKKVMEALKIINNIEIAFGAPYGDRLKFIMEETNLKSNEIHDIVWEILQEKSFEELFSRCGGYLNFYSRKENDEWVKYREEIGEPLPDQNFKEKK